LTFDYLSLEDDLIILETALLETLYKTELIRLKNLYQNVKNPMSLQEGSEICDKT
jgi:hypothetical protein